MLNTPVPEDARGHAAGTVGAYDALAADWDRGLGFRSPRFSARMREVVVRLLQPAAGGALAIELGAGTGWLFDATSPLFGQLHAIDASAPMLDICRARIAASGLRNVRADQGDAMVLHGVADASVNAVYAVGLLDAVPDASRVFAECARVLTPGGILVVATANAACPWHGVRDRLFGVNAVRTGRYLTAADLMALGAERGLDRIELVTWGAAPQRITSRPVTALFDAIERSMSALGLSRYLSILTASFRKH